MAGGSAGGSVTAGGSSGGSMAGGLAGGMAAGGMAVPPCDGGCEVWAVCNGAVQGGRCERGVLTVTQPVDGATYDAGTDVAVLASLALPDGGPWPTAVRIPATPTWGAPSMLPAGMAVTIPGPQAAGTGAVVVGWGGEGPAQQTRQLNFVSCVAQASCQPYQACVATVDGGRCETFPMAVSWVSPTGNGLERGPVNPGFNAVVRVDADAGVMLPGTVPLVLEDGGVLGPMTLTTGVGVRPAQYSVNVTLNGPEGTKVLVAGWADAGVSALVAAQRVFFDTTAPVVSLVTRARDGGTVADSVAPESWVKDEVAYVALTVTGATRGAQASDVQPMGFIGNPVVSPGNCGACAGSCVCVAVDLKDAPLDGLRGTVPVTVASFVDAVGNASAVQMASFAVTRVKWAANVSQVGGTVARAAIALDASGNLYLGTDDSLPGTSGRVVSLFPDGGVRWTRAGGAVQALAAANSTIETPTGARADVVFVAANEDSSGNKTGRLTAVLSSDGQATGLNASPCRVAGNPIFSAPSLMVLSGNSTGNTQQVGAFGMLSTGLSTGRVCGYGPASGNDNGPSNAQYRLPEPASTPPASAVNLVFTGAAHVGVLEDFSAQTWSWTSTASPAVGANQGRGGMGPTQTGLALIPTDAGVAVTVTTQVRDTGREPIGLLGTELGNAVYVPTDGGVFTRSAPVVVIPSSTANQWHLVGGGNPSTTDWLRVTTVTTAGPTAPGFVAGPRSAVQAMTPASEELLTSPVLGDASELYAVTKAGKLYVYGVTSAGAVTYKWHAQLTGIADVVAHPTLDCNRTRGMAPGVLYTVSSGGQVTAIVVDSRKLGTSPWPKWQRSAGNAGSLGASPSDFPLNPGCQ